MQTIGRNDPCPCGSGRKFKHCCERLGGLEADEPVPDWLSALRNEFSDRDFADQEEINAAAEQFFRRQNLTPVSDFHGLSADQMHRMLSYPFDSPDIVVLTDGVSAVPDAPIIRMFGHLSDFVGEKGLKPTAAGYLPRIVCRDIAPSYMDEETYRARTKYGQINKELDFYDLHVTRIVAQLAGLIRKYKGRFILSRDCRAHLKTGDLAAIYSVLFKTYVKKYNWGYWDNYPEIHFLQRSFLYTLLLLSKYGQAWLPATFYEDQFLRAFPRVLDEVPDLPYRTPEKTMRSCFTHRMLQRFTGFLGLAEIERTGEKYYNDEYRIRSTRLLTEVVTFHI